MSCHGAVPGALSLSLPSLRLELTVDRSLKAKKAPGLHEPRFFRKVMGILEAHRYRLPVRRFIIDLFEKSVMRRIVLDDDEMDGGSDDATADT